MTNTDLELLKLAAKGAGYHINFDEPVNGYFPHGCDNNGDVDAWWNPLKDDGDALRLAGRLASNGRVVCLSIGGGRTACEFLYQMHGADPEAATRRAIVCAAARIGMGSL